MRLTRHSSGGIWPKRTLEPEIIDTGMELSAPVREAQPELIQAARTMAES
jgi:hypothetical protein